MDILESFNKIKKQVQKIPCLHIANPLAPKIVEIDASELGTRVSSYKFSRTKNKFFNLLLHIEMIVKRITLYKTKLSIPFR